MGIKSERRIFKEIFVEIKSNIQRHNAANNEAL